ncbi:MAG: hypothetical protein DWQ10_03460 [Calditrichaeota bacterium]|nr:MAG: hypothetical protein DWQ10_03460 [Calditrichota bacterium]
MKYKTAKSSLDIYFVTSVITDHTLIFTNQRMASIPLESLAWFRDQNIWKIYAFCLMPNHVHFILRQLNSSPVDKYLGQFHSYTGHEIVRFLKTAKQLKSLDVLKTGAKRIKTKREHLVWQDCLVRIIETEDVLLQEMEYIHNNPISKKWALATSRSNYPYSSACFYDNGKNPIIEIDDVRELI